MKPEVYLKNILRHSLQLLENVEINNQMSTVETNLKKVIRKLQIASILYDKYVIGVAGLQGVGKSLMMQNFYHLPEGYLPVTMNRGERLPILITEHPLNEYQTYSIQIYYDANGELNKRETAISKEKLVELAREGNEDVAFLELRVPYQHFHNSQSAFLLLPGFEFSLDQYWDQLVDYSLMCSNTVIFSLSESRMADGPNEIKLKEIMEDFSDTKPIFTMNFSDMSSDENNSCKQNFMKEYLIAKSEEDRVICVGAWDHDKNEAWIQQLKSAVEKYRVLNKSHRKRQIDLLDGLIRRDLYMVVREVKENLIDTGLDSDIEKHRLDDILGHFDRQVTRLRDRYANRLEKLLTGASNEAMSDVRDQIIHQDGSGKVKDVFRAIFGSNSLKDDELLMQKIMNAYTLEDNSEYNHIYEERNAKAIHDVVQRTLSIVCQENGENKYFQLEDNGLQELSTEVTVDDRRYALSKDTAQDIINIMSGNNNQIASKDLKTPITLIPVIAAQQMAMAYTGQMYCDIAERGEVTNSIKHDYMKTFVNVLDKQDVILKSLVAVAGIDMVDGTANILTGVASMVGVTLSTKAAMLLTGGIGAGVAAAVFANNAKRSYCQNMRNDIKVASAIIADIHSATKETYLSIFDEYMIDLRDRVQIGLANMFHIKDLDTNYDNLIISNAMVEEDIKKFGETLNEYRYSLV